MARFFLGRRSTPDLVILVFALTIGIVVVGASTAVVIGEIINPEVDTSRAVARIAAIVASLVTAVVGYIAGKVEDRRDIEERNRE